MRTMLEPRLPGPMTKLALRYVEHAVGKRFESFAPVQTITRVRAPVLLVHGDEDLIVPVEDARSLFGASRRPSPAARGSRRGSREHRNAFPDRADAAPVLGGSSVAGGPGAAKDVTDS